MLKGVNRQILEVTNTESPYFERIIFFVSPEHSADSELKLTGEAKNVAGKMRKPPKLKSALKRRLKTAVFILLGAGAGAALTYLMGYIA